MNLSSIPHLVKEWHPTKNGDLTPDDVTHGSHKIVWWLCSKGHSFSSKVQYRTIRPQSRGCKFCAGQEVCEDNNLQFKFPNIAKEWHPTKNGKLTPKDVTSGTNKKVWWLCPNGHSYYSRIAGRTSLNRGCAECKGKKAGKDNNLETLFPEIAREWHPTKNGELTPKDVTYGSSRKKVWWLCPNGHSYDLAIAARTHKVKQKGCRFCAGQEVCEDNNLQFKFPNIAKEWHPTKNGDLTPKDVTSGTKRKVWWLCSKGHSYFSAINGRTGGNRGCKHCSKQSSGSEIRILAELTSIFNDVKSRYKIDGVELDIYLPYVNLAIEFDGFYWHKDKEKNDLEKNDFLLSLDINLIRVREETLKPLSKNDIIVRNNHHLEKNDLDELLKKVILFVNDDAKQKIEKYFQKKSFVNEDLFKKHQSYFPSPFPEKSLLSTHPLVAKEWDYEKNQPLSPENFTYGSTYKVWWICSRGHSYDATINNRTNRKSGCRFCSGQEVCEDNNLETLFPKIAREWHPTKNGDLTPKDVTPGTRRKVWWLCPNGHSHDQSIAARTSKTKKRGCRFCAGNLPSTK